ncbi:MAG: LacI family DNA-binding transcriptional regulator, partial [Hominenteromicrobium sp.]
MGVTIKDIAKISGVGISTVSRVLNHSGPVSSETRERVLKAVRSTNYIPNNSARSLKTTSSKNIAVLVKIITNAFFHKLIRVIEHEVNLRGYSVILQDVSGAADEIDSAIELAQDRNLCGVIIIGGRFSYTQEKFEQLGIPCVLLTVSAGENIDKSLYSSVIINDEEAGYQVTKQLIEMGHRKIGFVYHGPSNAAQENPNDLRFYGYRRALMESGIPVDPSLYDFGTLIAGSGYAVGYEAMQKLYAAHRDVTAVFAFADELA